MWKALVCIAKDEDHYIDEWVQYHLKLGFDEIWVYQNEWRYSGRFESDARVHLVMFDGENRQLDAYNDFLRNHCKGVDFAAFFDVDEFMCLKHGLTLDGFLSKFTRVSGVALNWKMFGDSGLAAPVGGDYSVVCRFTKCQSGFDSHVKTIVNINAPRKRPRFRNPHSLVDAPTNACVRAATDDGWVKGSYNRNAGDQPAWLNHYFCKTRVEFEGIKRKRGRADVNWSEKRHIYGSERFDECNFNDVEDRTACDFYSGCAT